MEDEIFLSWKPSIKKIKNLTVFGHFKHYDVFDRDKLFDNFDCGKNIKRIFRSNISKKLKRLFVNKCVDEYYEQEILDKIDPENMEWVFEVLQYQAFGEMENDDRIRCAREFMDNLEYLSSETIDGILENGLIQPWMYKKLDQYSEFEDELYDVAKPIFIKHFPNDYVPKNFAKLGKYFRGESAKHRLAVREFCEAVEEVFYKFVYDS